jgi:ketosteroid isomerase-like protein
MTSIDIVRAMYEAIARGDAAGVAAFISPEIRISQTRALPWGGDYEGLAGFAQFSRTLREHIASALEVETIFAAGEDVVVLGHTNGMTKTKGTAFSVAIAHVLTVRDAKIVQARYFIDTPAMLAALQA